MLSSIRSAALLSLALLLGCGGTETATDGGAGDAEEDPCASASDGTACGGGSICVASECVERRCGDGYADTEMDEDCDDGNDTAFDGCESDCTFTCSSNADCEDPEPCNGTEVCGSESHVCEVGEPLEERADCTRAPDVSDGVCRTMAGAPRCVPRGCGNGVVEGPDEVCDDGNDVIGDGCESDCTFTCEEDADCRDADACNGIETCTLETHTCASGEEPDCDDANDCTVDTCEAGPGCVRTLIDEDRDGFAPDTIGPCGTDCDDEERTVGPESAELCGNGVDDDCDPATGDTVNTLYYADCDGDGFAVSGASGLASCLPPDTEPCGVGSRWTGLPPTSMRNTDCDDSLASRAPGLLDVCDGLDNDCDPNIDEDPSPEVCNGRDDDCNGATDEGTTVLCYADGDGDGYGRGAQQAICPSGTGACPSGFATPSGDCDDTLSDVSPIATETCNLRDDDCVAGIDNGVTIPCYADGDGDTYGAGAVMALCPVDGACPAGTAAMNGDCDNAVDSTYPGATEQCNAVDDDCNAILDQGFTCAQNATYACTNACGVAGTRSCDSTCSGFVGACAAVERCNYCDDNGADGLLDEMPLATVNPALIEPACDTSFGSASGCTFNTISPFVNANNETSGVRYGTRTVVGYGPLELELTMSTTRNGSGNPEHGWALVLYLDPATTWLGAGLVNLGVNHSNRGYAAEWRYYDAEGMPASQADRAVLRPLLGDGARAATIGTGANVNPRFDSTSSTFTTVEQTLRMVVTPDIPGTSQNELSVTVSHPVLIGSGTVASCMGDACPVRIVPGDAVVFGATAAAGASNAPIINPGAGGLLGGDPPMTMDRAALCP
jgi:cysteine-rich repeat protein